MVNPLLRTVPLVKLGQDEPYAVIAERTAESRLYTNQAKAAGKPWRVARTNIAPGLLHKYLLAYVYGGRFWSRLWPVWVLWPILAVAVLVCGQIIDMRRLRKARQTGVYLRGNRMVDAGEWNSRANEVTSA